MVELAADARTALRQLDGDGGRLAELQAEVEVAERRARAAAAKLSRARASALPRFTRDVESELADLGMEDAKLEPALETADMGARGTDALTLLIAANPGLPAAPLSQTASGGELSRIALAIRVAARSGGGPARCCWTRSTPASAAARRTPSARSCKALAAEAPSCSASRTCPRSPARPTPTSASRSCRATRRRRASSGSATAEVVDEVARMLGADEGDAAARRHARCDRQGELTAASGS